MLKPYNRAELTFRLEESIGDEGKNSEVFTAHDPQLDAQIVIKKIKKETFSDAEEYYRESSILYLSGHPNVVPIHYACEDESSIYLAMPYYTNGSLNKLLNEGFLTVREIIKISTQFLSGLHNIHSKKLIHFDIKPDNILISNQNEAQVSDFGLTKPVGPNGLALQDRAYLKTVPPESLNTEEHSIAYDIYQAGLTIYRMCLGNEEFYRQFDDFGDVDTFDRDRFRFALRNGRFPDRNNFLEHTPQALTNVIKKSLSTDPIDRYDSILSMINAFADIDDPWLDWSYSVNEDGDRNWTKQGKTCTFSLIVTNEKNSIATKTMFSGRTQRITEYCLDSINRSQIKSFLRSH